MRIIGKIILFLLKFIGILLLILVGLVLLILLAPIRYRLRGKAEGEETFVKGRASWLFSLIQVSFAWQKADLSYRLRILGIPVFPKRKKKQTDIPEAKLPEAVEEIAEEAVEEPLRPEEESFSELAKAEIEKTISEVAEPEPEESLAKRAGEEIEKLLSQAAGTDGQRAEEEADGELPVTEEDAAEENRPDPDEETAKKPEEEVSGAGSKKKKPAAGKKSKEGKKSGEGKFQSISHKIQQVKEFLQKEEHKKTFSRIRRELRRIVRHLLPTRLRIKGIFGFSDPALTGKVLGVLALLLPFYKDSVRMTPDFTGKRLEGEISLKGRIRLGTLSVSAVRLLLDKNIRKWIRQVW